MEKESVEPAKGLSESEGLGCCFLSIGLGCGLMMIGLGVAAVIAAYALLR